MIQTSTLRCAKTDSGSNRRSKRRLGKGSMVDWVVGFIYIWVVLLVNIGKLYHFWGWWFQIFFIFTTIFGEMVPFDEHLFQRGWFNHQLESCFWFQILDGPKGQKTYVVT